MAAECCSSCERTSNTNGRLAIPALAGLLVTLANSNEEALSAACNQQHWEVCFSSQYMIRQVGVRLTVKIDITRPKTIIATKEAA